MLDFGIAAPRGTAVSLAGTPEYMAPEVLVGQAPTEAADLYAVGVMLYQILTGRLPYGYGANMATQLSPSQSDTPSTIVPMGATPEPATAWDPAGPQLGLVVPPQLAPGDPLAPIVLRLLEQDPAQRYHSTGQVLADLAAAQGKPLHVDTAATRESFLAASLFVGRQRELTILNTALEQARRGAGSVILLSGESGVGKSRLLDEVRSCALVRGVRVLRGQSVNTAGSSYDMFVDVLRALVLDTPLQGMEAAVLKELLPELPTLLGTPIANPPGLGAQATRRRLRRVLVDVLLRPQEPMLLLLEDIQWASPDSLELLRELIPKTQSHSLLIIASARDDEQSDHTSSLPGATALRLSRLDSQAIAALCLSMLGEAGTQPELLALLDRETEGNAFFIVEVVRALAEEAGSLALVGTRGLPQHVFAGGVQTVVARRLNRVPEWAKPLLKLAAVAGRKLDRRVLATFEPELERWLQVCSDAAILEATEAEWRFSHDKLRDRLLALLPDDERRRLHWRMGKAMEAVYGTQGTHMSVLGYHFEAGGDLHRAGEYLASAGASALRRGAVHEAATLLERAVKLQEQTNVAPLVRATTLRRLSKAVYGLGRHAECLDIARRAMALIGRPVPKTPLRRIGAIVQEAAEELSHRMLGTPLKKKPLSRAAAQELLTLTRGTSDAYFIIKGRRTEAIYVMLGALHAAEEIDEPVEQAHYLMFIGLLAYLLPMHRLGRYYMGLAQQQLPRVPDGVSLGGYHAIGAYMHSAEGQWEESLSCLDLWMNNVTRVGDEAQQALIYRTRATLWLVLGRIDKAREYIDAELRIGKRLNNQTAIASSCMCSAIVCIYRGEPEQAQRLLLEAADLIDQADSAVHVLMVSSMLAAVACRLGDREQAKQRLPVALRWMRRLQAPAMQYFEAYASAVDAALHLWQTAVSAAERREMEAQALQVLWHMMRFTLTFPIGRPRALTSAGRYLLTRGQKKWALRCMQTGLSEATRLQMPQEQARSHLWLSRIGSGADAAELMPEAEAQQHLQTARELFASLGMTEPAM